MWKGKAELGKNRPEKVVKTKRQGRKEKQVKRLRIYMGIVAVAACISVICALLLAYFQVFHQTSGQEESSALESTPQWEQNAQELPVYTDDFNLLLVNSYEKLPDDWESQIQSFQGIQLDQRILPALEALLEKAKEDGISLGVSGGYVEASQQEQLYNQYVQTLLEQGYSPVRAEDKAQTDLGKGGYSESQTGLSLDFTSSEENFLSSDAYQWLMEHAGEFGFVQRFPQGKEEATGRKASDSCFRYVGVKHAGNMRRLSMCLEEYVVYIQSQQN